MRKTRNAADSSPLSRIVLHPVPPEGFDILKASDRELSHYRLPPRPDARRSPELRAFWERMFAPPLSFITPKPIPLDVRHLLQQGAGSHGVGATGSAALQFTPTRWGTSQNWSGAVLKARDGMRFHRLGGRWTVPTPSRPSGVFANTRPPNDTWQASVWLGFDGFFQWSKSLPQLGTVSQATLQKNGRIKQETYVFGQWWVRGDPKNREVKIDGIAAAPGDEVYCDLTMMQAGQEVYMHVVNRTQGTMFGFTWHCNKRSPDQKEPDSFDAPAEGCTAVWCLERPLTLPTDPDPMQYFIMPNLDNPSATPDKQPTTLAELWAEMQDPNDPNNTVARDLTGARFIRMVARLEDPKVPRSVFLTSPVPPNQTFDGRWFNIKQLDR